MKRLICLCLYLVLVPAVAASGQTFTRADTLRGSWTHAERAWWDVSFYDLHVWCRMGSA